MILNFPNQSVKILIHINMLHLAYCSLLSGNKQSVKVVIISRINVFLVFLSGKQRKVHKDLVYHPLRSSFINYQYSCRLI